MSLGWSIKNSAIAVGINYDYAQEILKKYNELGEQGVKNLKATSHRKLRGKKPLLSLEKVEQLKKELAAKPSDGGIWTGPKVARWSAKETGVKKVWNQRGWDYFRTNPLLTKFFQQ